MIRKAGIILLIIFIAISLIACSKKTDNKEGLEDNGQVDEGPDEEPDYEPDEIPEGVQSPLSGLYADEEKVNRRPIIVMFDNHPNARWQSGLSEAEIIYEYKVEGSFTRYLGIFLINEPESIGPIRSARPYFITTVLEYDGVFVRCGGSSIANMDIIDLNVNNIDCMTSGSDVFWRRRDLGKSAPNNLYSSLGVLRQVEISKSYNKDPDYRGFLFNDEEGIRDGSSANNIEIIYNKNNNTKYVYDENEKVYIRYKDGDLHIDELNEEKIKAKNIIIQEADSRVIGSGGILEIDTIGKGKGLYITLGKAINISWEKENRKGKTYFFDEAGEEIRLNPGQTWIQVVDVGANIIIE